MGFRFSLGWALFQIFAETTSWLPWPLREFLLGQFRDEFVAQMTVVRSWTPYLNESALIVSD